MFSSVSSSNWGFVCIFSFYFLKTLLTRLYDAGGAAAAAITPAPAADPRAAAAAAAERRAAMAAAAEKRLTEVAK